MVSPDSQPAQVKSADNEELKGEAVTLSQVALAVNVALVIAICLSADVSSGDMSEWIWMPFGVMSRRRRGLSIFLLTLTLTPNPNEELEGGTVTLSHHLALAVNVALLAGIVFVVAVFLAVVVSVVLHRRRRQHCPTPGSSVPPAVSRPPRIKPADVSPAGTTHASSVIYPPKPPARLFVSVSKVGDPKEWFV